MALLKSSMPKAQKARSFLSGEETAARLPNSRLRVLTRVSWMIYGNCGRNEATPPTRDDRNRARLDAQYRILRNANSVSNKMSL